MKEVVLLAAGQGSKFWPYQSTRNKCMMPIGNVALLSRTVQTCLKANVEHILIASITHTEQILYAFRNVPQVEVITLQATKGSADTLLQCIPYLKSKDPFVFYGDTYIHPEDLMGFLQIARIGQSLVSALKESALHWIACRIQEESLIEFGAHQRGDTMTHQWLGGHVNLEFIEQCRKNPHKFTPLKVGVGSPEEAYLEMSLMDWKESGQSLTVIETQKPSFDIDKPWHALQANAYVVEEACLQLTKHHLDPSSTLDPSAHITGFIQVGKESHIGRHVVITGNVIIGDHTTIENGVVITGPCIIGDDCHLSDIAKVHAYSTIGHHSKLSQGFEFSGMMLNHVYGVHYGEYYGLIGENTDLGAGTTSGTLRFDDQQTQHNTLGHKETPHDFANASYLGDYCRTGVGALLMPGVKVGSNSVVGSGVVLQEDVEDKTLIYQEQTLKKKAWGPSRYGW